ncbi:IS110 family transposase [Streptomyces sp. RLA2-12]|nr:IS110 family transposase [Streptomyces sp. RLA2-12]QDN55535.1 IS110 family transposase [Streptomyces sp. S1D4-20]QDN65713.1 IS110 family transposase [Streptomyces sp. S1D4-14]QDO48118.1 IS110 family transposase [Streptomyces sp. RLB3-5]QDO58360.1 IS110 family transposase [Streptomyces sp. RLB1-8]
MYEVRRATGGTMAWNWAGTDIGKAHHHTVVLNNDGEVLLSRKVVNDEADLLHLISEVLTLGETVVWSVDVADGMAFPAGQPPAQPWTDHRLSARPRRESGIGWLPRPGQKRCEGRPGHR